MSTIKHASLFDLERVYARDDLTLDGGKLSVALGDAVQALQVERTMEGASTLTVAVIDEDHALLTETELLGRDRVKRGITLAVDGRTHRLMEVEKRRHGLDLVFYDEPSARLMAKKGAIKASRNKMTRPEMVAWMCRLAGTGSYIPELKDRPVIADLDGADAKAIRRSRTAAGRARTATRPAGTLKTAKGLTVKGDPATSEQRRNMEEVQSACEELDVSPKERLACALAPIGESSYTTSAVNPKSGARAVFQLLASTAASLGLDPSDTNACAKQFLKGGFRGPNTGVIDYNKANPSVSVGKLVSLTEGSDADGAFYDKYRDEAVRIVEAWQPGGGGGARTGSDDRAYQETYEFAVEADEDYFQAAVRMAEEVRWRLFSNGRKIVYATDLKLAEAPVAYAIEEGRNGCDEINWTWTAGGRIDEVEATIRLARWAAPPGSVVEVRSEGPPDDFYLVRSISRDLLDASCTASVTLGRPQRPLPEPAPTVRTVQGTAASDAADEESGTGRSRTGGREGKWTYAPGVPKTLTAKMQSFLDRMATFHDKTIVVTTSTNHDRYVAGTTRVSNHVGGGAADLGSNANWGGEIDGRGGFELAIAAHRACGSSYKEAVARANVPNYTRWPCKEGGVQILWRVEGHHDHVHIGTG